MALGLIAHASWVTWRATQSFAILARQDGSARVVIVERDTLGNVCCPAQSMQEYERMKTQVAGWRQKARQRIAQQTSRVQELQKAGFKTLASVARKILTAMEKSEQLMEPFRYRQLKKRRVRVR